MMVYKNRRWIKTDSLSTKQTGFIKKWPLASVSGARTNEYFFRISIRAILASMRANLIPMQLRGPQPKGMWQRAGRFAFSSGVNPRKRGKDGGRTREEGRRKTVPFWVKCLWFWPEFWIVVHKVDRELHCHSLRNCHSVDLDGLFSETWGTAKEHYTALLLSGHTPTLASHKLLLCTNCTIIVCPKLAICTE